MSKIQFISCIYELQYFSSFRFCDLLRYIDASSPKNIEDDTTGVITPLNTGLIAAEQWNNPILIIVLYRQAAEHILQHAWLKMIVAGRQEAERMPHRKRWTVESLIKDCSECLDSKPLTKSGIVSLNHQPQIYDIFWKSSHLLEILQYG